MSDVGLIVDQADWAKLKVGGADRKRFLQGMISNDLDRLGAEPFIRATVLNPKGRVLALVDVVDQRDAYLLLVEPGHGDKLRQVLERHAIMDDVTFTAAEGPCHRVWGDPWTAPPILAAAADAPATEGTVEVRRVEAGLPRYGRDVSEDHFPFEANLDSTISYTKGCYVGQEVVARAHARGHANKRLVGIRVGGEVAVGQGAPVSSPARPEAGQVTSSVVSPRFGVIALAYLHKSTWDPGTAVRIGERTGVVAALPFSET
jgi:tRNA-modifying protein YgfZ